MILAIRQALQTPLRPSAPKPASKEADTTKASRQPANAPPSTEELPPFAPPEFRQATTDDCPERAMWVAVLKLALLDAKSTNPDLRSDALAFFQSADFLKVMDYAGIDRDLAPGIRAKVRYLKPKPACTYALAA